MNEDDGGSGEAKGLLDDTTGVDGDLGGDAFGDFLLTQLLVLAVQEDGGDDLLALAGEERAEVIRDACRRLEGRCRELTRAEALAEFKRSLDLCGLRRTNPRQSEKVLDVGAIQPGQTVEDPEESAAEVGGVLS